METQTPYLTPSLSDSHQQPPLVWELIRWLQAVAHQWQTITRAPTEWVIPREIGIAIPHGWATESSPPAPAPGLCPPTTTICTSRFPANQEPQTTTTTLATAPPGGILTSTDSTATFHHVTGKDSSTTTGDSGPRDSTSSSLTFKSRRSRRMTVRRRLPITLPARFRCLLTRSTSSRTSSARRIKDASRRSQQTSSWCHSMDTSP
uniref:Assembly activating protein AAP n=1 Tax=Adeno-associated virus TaxID=272636 RepID=A0A513ZUZ6_9VIRU|nr:assembly activating protein AAP [Adeno-associated virus]